MWTRSAALCSLIASSAAAEAPLSAIDWLSQSVETDQVGALPGMVTVEPLGAPPRAFGYVSPASVGLPRSIWTDSVSSDLVNLLVRMPADMPLPLRDALTTLLVVEAPADDPDHEFLLARIDALLVLGRIDAAQRLIADAGILDASLFRRTFDISLLTGHEDAECRRLRSQPGISPTYPARIFCLARQGDWQAAALTLENGEALNVLSPDEVSILGRFLDDGEDDLLPPPERPATITPLVFRLYEAIGAPIATRSLPLAFAHADLRHQNGWKARIEAAERLYRAGAIQGETLMALYAERAPAASGGVWDRVAAVQTWRSAADERKAEAEEHATALLAEEGLERLIGHQGGPRRAGPIDRDAAPDQDVASMIASGREGEAALAAILRASQAWEGDPDDLSRALAALEIIGLEIEESEEEPKWAANQ